MHCIKAPECLQSTAYMYMHNYLKESPTITKEIITGRTCRCTCTCECGGCTRVVPAVVCLNELWYVPLTRMLETHSISCRKMQVKSYFDSRKTLLNLKSFQIIAVNPHPPLNPHSPPPLFPCLHSCHIGYEPVQISYNACLSLAYTLRKFIHL